MTKKWFGSLLLMLLCCCSFPGCATQQCTYERVALNSVMSAVEHLEKVTGEEEDPRVATALAAARGAINVGRQSVEACSIVRDDGSWRDWVALVLSGVGGVVELLDTVGIPIPRIVTDVLYMMSSIVKVDDLSPVSPAP